MPGSLNALDPTLQYLLLGSAVNALLNQRRFQRTLERVVEHYVGAIVEPVRGEVGRQTC